MNTVPAIYCTSYCNKGHFLQDGVPAEHECFVLPPAALRAESEDKIAEACRLIAEAKPLRRHRGRKLVDPPRRLKKDRLDIRQMDGVDPNRPTLSERLRYLIEISGKSPTELSRATGVERCTIARFYSGQRSMHLDLADRLFAYLESIQS